MKRYITPVIIGATGSSIFPVAVEAALAVASAVGFVAGAKAANAVFGDDRAPIKLESISEIIFPNKSKEKCLA